MVMLQMAEKTTKTKRRALLMTQNEPASTPAPSPNPAAFQEPQPLPGDPFDRMLAAQSEIERVPLVTLDPAFAMFGIRTYW